MIAVFPGWKRGGRELSWRNWSRIECESQLEMPSATVFNVDYNGDTGSNSHKGAELSEREMRRGKVINGKSRGESGAFLVGRNGRRKEKRSQRRVTKKRNGVKLKTALQALVRGMRSRRKDKKRWISTEERWHGSQREKRSWTGAAGGPGRDDRPN